MPWNYTKLLCSSALKTQYTTLFTPNFNFERLFPNRCSAACHSFCRARTRRICWPICAGTAAILFFHVRPRFLLTMIHSSPEYRSTLDSFCTAGYCIVVPPPDMQQYTSSLSPHCPQTPQHLLKKRFCHMSLSKSVK